MPRCVRQRRYKTERTIKARHPRSHFPFSMTKQVSLHRQAGDHLPLRIPLRSDSRRNWYCNPHVQGRQSNPHPGPANATGEDAIPEGRRLCEFRPAREYNIYQAVTQFELLLRPRPPAPPRPGRRNPPPRRRTPSQSATHCRSKKRSHTVFECEVTIPEKGESWHAFGLHHFCPETRLYIPYSQSAIVCTDETPRSCTDHRPPPA